MKKSYFTKRRESLEAKDKKIYASACMVLENHIDGALEDLSEDNKDFILSCILALGKLGDAKGKAYFDKWFLKVQKLEKNKGAN